MLILKRILVLALISTSTNTIITTNTCTITNTSFGTGTGTSTRTFVAILAQGWGGPARLRESWPRLSIGEMVVPEGAEGRTGGGEAG